MRFVLGSIGLITSSLAILGIVRGVITAWWLRRYSVVMEPHRRGDYESALQACEGLEVRGKVTRPYCFFRGTNLSHLGRLEEAEVWLRRNIAMHQKDWYKRDLAIGFTALGEAMLQAGRYDDAQQSFEASLTHFPQRGSDYRCMAELCLLRRDNPVEPLRLAKLAIEHDQVDLSLSLEGRRTIVGEAQATLAWATATGTHNPSEVARLVAEAVDSVGERYVPATALVRYQSGRAYAELGDFQASTQHYEEAARLDPQGNWGRAARAALTSSRGDGQ